VPRLYYGGVSDTRACSTCSCGSPSGADCNANAHVQILDGCGAGGHLLVDMHPLPETCSASTTPSAAIHGGTFTTTASGGSCGASGGSPTGTVAQTDPVTICCMP
jgi:hypothetical protein